VAVLAQHAFNTFEDELRKCSELAIYGPNEVALAAEWGAVEWLLVCGSPSNSLASAVTRRGGKVLSFDENTHPIEYDLLSKFTGVCANLRFALPEYDDLEAIAMRTISSNNSDHNNNNNNSSNNNNNTNNKNNISTVVVRRIPSKVKPTKRKVPTSLPIESILRAYDSSSSSESESDSDLEHLINEEALDEIESMEAIYPNDNSNDNQQEEEDSIQFHRLANNSKMCLLIIKVVGVGSVAARIVLPDQYPDAPLDIALEAHCGISTTQAATLTSSAFQLCKDLEGEPAMFSLALHLQETLQSFA